MFLELSHFLVPLPVSSSCYYRDQDKLSETSTCFLVPNLHSECPVFTVSSYLTICNANSCFQLNAPADIPQETRTSECHWLKGCGTRLKAAALHLGDASQHFLRATTDGATCSALERKLMQSSAAVTALCRLPALPSPGAAPSAQQSWGCLLPASECCHRIPPGSH